jgi:hypothetical protein
VTRIEGSRTNARSFDHALAGGTAEVTASRPASSTYAKSRAALTPERKSIAAASWS